MEQVKLNEVVDIAQYERIRPQFREQVLEQKQRRRLGVGPVFMFLFENHLTVLYQVQEMLRTERIVEERAITHELNTYNELIPPAGGLGASLLIEYTDPAERDTALRKLVGIEHHVRLELDRLPPVPGEFDLRQMSGERVSSVQYLTFALTPEHRARWSELGRAGKIRLVVDHPFYTHSTALPADVAAALGEDLAS